VRCHSAFPLNQGRTLGGIFHILGVPKTYQSGESYPITIVIGQPGQARWGFELSARLSASGSQAGRLAPADEMTQIKEAGGIQYIEHTSSGNRRGTTDGPVEFHLNWIAPDTGQGAVIFNAAGNAADASGTPQGDYIYSAGAYSGVEGTAPARMQAPTTGEARPLERTNPGTRLLHLPAPKELSKGSLIFTVQHRFLGAIVDSRPGNAFGIDQGANINLELMYAATKRITLGVSRARVALAGAGFAPAILTFGGTYTIHDTEKSPWKMAVVTGVEGQRNFEQQFSPYLQLTTSWDYKRLRTFVVPTVVFNSRDDTALQALRSVAIHPENDHTLSLGVGGDFALTSQLSLAAEYIPRLAGFGGFGEAHPTVAAGINLQTWRHVFTIMLSRSRDFTPARYAVNADGPWALGFNIYRRIK
jgi:hypothetical protein